MMFCRAGLVAVGVCVPTAFLGCGTDSDSGGGPAGSPGAFCTDESHFMPDNEIELLHHCDGDSLVPKETCEAKGCVSRMGCTCNSQTSCDGVGGTWNEVKCKDLGGKWTDFINHASEARSNDNSCEGKVTTFPDDGASYGYGTGDSMDLRVAVGKVARACCSSFPATVCDENNLAAATCKLPADLLVDEGHYGECASFYANITTCGEHGCWTYNWDCICDTEATCTSAGSRWLKKTCGDDMRDRNDDYYAKIAAARASGSCVDSNGKALMVMPGDLSLPVDDSITSPKKLASMTSANRKCCNDESDFCASTGEEVLV